MKPRRQYKDEHGNRLPSVTTILNAAIAKNALTTWAARVAAEATADALLDGFCSKDMAIEEGTKAPISKRDWAGRLGTQAHNLIERHYEGLPVSADGENADLLMDCYRRAVGAIDERWDVIASEWAAVSSMKFGGTLDMICVEKDTGKRILVDLKTGSYHNDHIAQVAAYRHLWNEHNQDRQVVNACILFVPVKDKTVEILNIQEKAIDAGWEVFKAAFTIYSNLPKLKYENGKENDL